MSNTRPHPEYCGEPYLQRRWLCKVGVVMTVGAGLQTQGWAQADNQQTENRVKAAYLYKFAGYVQWPAAVLPEPDGAIVIGVLGSDVLADELTQMVADRRVGSHLLHVRRLRRREPPTDVHILFISRSESQGLNELLASLRGKPILIVTEAAVNFPAGSIVNFVFMDDKIRFDVAPRQGELAGLKISARLLSVASRVIGDST